MDHDDAAAKLADAVALLETEQLLGEMIVRRATHHSSVLANQRHPRPPSPSTASDSTPHRPRLTPSLRHPQALDVDWEAEECCRQEQADGCVDHAECKPTAGGQVDAQLLAPRLAAGGSDDIAATQAHPDAQLPQLRGDVAAAQARADAQLAVQLNLEELGLLMETLQRFKQCKDDDLPLVLPEATASRCQTMAWHATSTNCSLGSFFLSRAAPAAM